MKGMSCQSSTMIKYPANMQTIDRRMKVMNELFFDLHEDGISYVEIGKLMRCSSGWARHRVMRHRWHIEDKKNSMKEREA